MAAMLMPEMSCRYRYRFICDIKLNTAIDLVFIFTPTHARTVKMAAMLMPEMSCSYRYRFTCEIKLNTAFDLAFYFIRKYVSFNK